MSEQQEHVLKFDLRDFVGAQYFIDVYDDEVDTLISREEATDRSQMEIVGLIPARIYRLELRQDGSLIHTTYHITKSLSSGEIQHYFDHPLSAYQGDIEPSGTTFAEVEKAIKDLIKSAKFSIDYCAYNSNVTSIINSLIDASNRGVRVRLITDKGTSNTALTTNLPFSIVKGNNDGIMHNKFIIVDADLESSTLVMGTMNFTTTQMKSDPNHLMFIQDQSLAKCYEKEFEEMWGSDTAIPNLSKGRFGKDKSDNTPHQFTIGGRRVEQYFSPSDHTSQFIAHEISKADTKLDIGLLIFTYFDLRDAVIAAFMRSVNTRIILDDYENSKDVVAALSAKGIPIVIHESSSIFHYKTAVIDADDHSSDPTLITGSHNWTWSAENINDENTIIIHDASITKLYERAFQYQWSQLSTSITEAPIVLSVIALFDINGHLHIDNQIGKAIQVNVVDELGRIVNTFEIMPGEHYLDDGSLQTGFYVISIKVDDRYFSQKMVKL